MRATAFGFDRGRRSQLGGRVREQSVSRIKVTHLPAWRGIVRGLGFSVCVCVCVFSFSVHNFLHGANGLSRAKHG